MKTEPNEPISPHSGIRSEKLSHPMAQGMSHTVEYTMVGLTKREFFAAMAMQGLVAAGQMKHIHEAPRYADALIQALNDERK